MNQPTILIIDDTPDNLTLIHGLLKDHYKVKVANHGEKGLKIAGISPAPDLILLDIMMPEIDGYEVCRRLKSNPDLAHIPVIFLTAKSEPQDEEYGLSIGAVDYITKPISPAIVLARIATHLQLKASADFLRDKNEFLSQEIIKRTKKISDLQDVTILALTSLAETRDTDTGNHIRRTQHYVKLLALELHKKPEYKTLLTDNYISILYKSAPLHDIGKVGIPDHILMKAGRLTAEEFEIMKTHTTLGWRALDQAERNLGIQVDFLTCAKEIALSHQEKWDGSGYPHALRGTQIPLSARLMALADVYDALISKRVYKNALPHAKAAEMIIAERGRHFDPDIVDAFISQRLNFQQIAEQYHDNQHS